MEGYTDSQVAETIQSFQKYCSQVVTLEIPDAPGSDAGCSTVIGIGELIDLDRLRTSVLAALATSDNVGTHRDCNLSFERAFAEWFNQDHAYDKVIAKHPSETCSAGGGVDEL